MGVIRACFASGNWVPKNLTEAACCSSTVIWLSWEATGISLGVIGKSEPLVIRKDCIWLCMEMA